MSRRHCVGASACLAALVLTGCQSHGDTPPPVPALMDAEDVVAPELTAFIPERVEGGSARVNQPHIDYVIEAAISESRTRVAGRDVVDLLVTLGYEKDAMELTPDFSLIELPADSTSLAIRFEGECVVTQWGNDWFVSSVEPVVAGGVCLLGRTVSLD